MATEREPAMKLPPLKCDVCGRFLAYADLGSGRAVRRLEEPDSAFGGEVYETLCRDHAPQPAGAAP